MSLKDPVIDHLRAVQLRGMTDVRWLGILTSLDLIAWRREAWVLTERGKERLEGAK